MLEYYAAFPGCAEHSEPSAAAIALLIEKIKEKKVSTVYYIEFSNHNISRQPCRCDRNRASAVLHLP